MKQATQPPGRAGIPRSPLHSRGHAADAGTPSLSSHSRRCRDGSSPPAGKACHGSPKVSLPRTIPAGLREPALISPGQHYVRAEKLTLGHLDKGVTWTRTDTGHRVCPVHSWCCRLLSPRIQTLPLPWVSVCVGVGVCVCVWCTDMHRCGQGERGPCASQRRRQYRQYQTMLAAWQQVGRTTVPGSWGGPVQFT